MKKGLLSVVSAVLLFGGLYAITKSDETCINLYVDYGKLDNGTKLTKCINASTKVNALDLLKQTDLTIEGTKRWGDSVICRVNGLPDATIEPCDDMPSAKAYWAILIKEKQVLPLPTKEWGWGQLAIDQQYLTAGDSIGLVWADNGKVVFP